MILRMTKESFQCRALVGLGALVLTALATLASAQPLESDAGSDKLEAVETARQTLEQSFAALAYDEGSWSAYQTLCKTCQAARPQARDRAPSLPQDPLGPLNLASLQATIQAQIADYNQALWQQASVSQAALSRYKKRCTACRSEEEITQRSVEIERQEQAWKAQRKECQAAGAPQQYGGIHRWHQDRAAAVSACQSAQSANPQDPWAAYLLWRSQADGAMDAALLHYAVQHAVPPALAAAAWQTLATPPHDLARAQRLADAASAAGDFNGMVIATLIQEQQGGTPARLMERLQPALDQDHPWALQIAAKLEALPPLKIAYLGLAARQGDPKAQAALLRAWEKNLSGSRLRKQAARAHIAAVAEGQSLARSLWLDNGDQRPQRLIKAVQAELIGLKLLSGNPDGVWGKNTEGAVRRVNSAMIESWGLTATTGSDAIAQNADDEELDLASAETAAGAIEPDARYEDDNKAYESGDDEGAGFEGAERVEEANSDDSPTTSNDLAATSAQAQATQKPAPLLANVSKAAALAKPETHEAHSPSFAPARAPLPKRKGELALIDPEAEEAAAPRKRGTVFKRKK